jgi:nitrogen fixation/metabolism regulation signal transduction histidine kinase
VGIDNQDIFQGVRALRALLLRTAAALLLVAVFLALVLARRTTAPILALQEHARRVAEGDLAARTPVRSRDELGQLAADLNAMSAELEQHRIREVKAEKDAAWREMARQVAHDIKNPLTPIKLSIDLLKRAKQERSPQFDRIFERTVDTVSKQVDHLRDIAGDFHALTGLEGVKPSAIDLDRLLSEVLDLNAAWAESLGVSVTRRLEPARVAADPALLRRVFVNLVSNALQAMPQGGALELTLDREQGRARARITDTGPGLPEAVRARLFEPYFTTRSGGTGLGLAIAKRVIDGCGGRLTLDGAPSGRGTVAQVELPLLESSREPGASGPGALA